MWALLVPVEAAERCNLSSEDRTVKHVKDLSMKLEECCLKAEEIRDEMDKTVFWNVIQIVTARCVNPTTFSCVS